MAISLSQQLSSITKDAFGSHAVMLQGRVTGVSGMTVKIGGVDAQLSIGDRVSLVTRDDRQILAEIVGFQGRIACAMAFEDIRGVGPGSVVYAPAAPALNETINKHAFLSPSATWLGRVMNPLGQPLDGKGALQNGEAPRRVRSNPPQANLRARLGRQLDLGISVLDIFTTCREGQRIGLFAGSGIGKSSLLSMLARFAACDVIVLALVGERGREVREFLEDDLGPNGLARSVVVIATSDSPPLMRREAAYTAMTIAEHFRDEGKSVLFLMDSLTRFCLALREIGLSAGEPPATRGYPPSVFAELPGLLERAGPGFDHAEGIPGQITALFTVLVEGDDHNEPVADAARGILDGHVVLDRRIAEAGRFPAVDVLRSLSRTVPGCLGEQENKAVRRARALLTSYAETADIVRLGAYKPGLDLLADDAIHLGPRIEEILRQDKDQCCTLNESFHRLNEILELSHAS